MTRAVIGRAFGDPENFTLEPFDPGAPGPGKVRIAVRAAGLSFVDVLVAKGQYQALPPLPLIPGSEYSGVIEAVGEGVAPDRIGQRVIAGGFGGALTEAAIVPAHIALPMPDSLSFAQGAVFRVSYATVYHALVQRAQLQPGETLLILGAGGAVGYAAVELGKALGARVIASASNAAKRALATRGGADAVVDSGSESWRADVVAANDGRPVDVVVDPVGGDQTERAFRSLAWKGRHLVLGFASGPIPRLPVNLALLKGAALIGVDIRQFGIHEAELSRANLSALMVLQGEGRLNPPIAQSFPIEDYLAAMKLAFAGETAGRIVVTMGG